MILGSTFNIDHRSRVTDRQNWIERCTSRVLPLSIGVFRLKIALPVSEELCLQAKPRILHAFYMLNRTRKFWSTLNLDHRSTVTARQNRIEHCTSRVLPLSIDVFLLKITLLVSKELCLQAKPLLCPEKKEKEKERIIIHKRKLCPELIINEFRPIIPRFRNSLAYYQIFDSNVSTV